MKVQTQPDGVGEVTQAGPFFPSEAGDRAKSGKVQGKKNKEERNKATSTSRLPPLLRSPDDKS